MNLSKIIIGILLVFEAASCFSWFGEQYCNNSHYKCITIKRGDSWGELFPDPAKMDIVRRINRLNIFLSPDMIIAVPNDLDKATINSFSPFAQYIKSNGEKKIHVSLQQLAWAAYNKEGQLLRWGPLSPGAKQCLDDPAGCSTPTGTFRIIRKGGADCVSKKFPQTMNGMRGGAEMPFCMFFYQGYALHGSSELPGYPASYGCLRLLIDDAKWLHDQFIELPVGSKKGTPIMIQEGSDVI